MSCKIIWYPAKFLLPTIDGCDNKLGMEDGRIRDGQLTSSGDYPHFKYHGPTNARLNEAPRAATVGAWIAEKNDRDQWIQVAFGEAVNVTGVMIQGRKAGSEHYVSKFKVLYSDDSVHWTYVQTADNQGDKVWIRK